MLQLEIRAALSPTLREPLVKHLSLHHQLETTEREGSQQKEWQEQWEHTQHPLTEAFYLRFYLFMQESARLRERERAERWGVGGGA